MFISKRQDGASHKFFNTTSSLVIGLAILGTPGDGFSFPGKEDEDKPLRPAISKQVATNKKVLEEDLGEAEKNEKKGAQQKGEIEETLNTGKSLQSKPSFVERKRGLGKFRFLNKNLFLLVLKHALPLRGPQFLKTFLSLQCTSKDMKAVIEEDMENPGKHTVGEIVNKRIGFERWRKDFRSGMDEYRMWVKEICSNLWIDVGYWGCINPFTEPPTLLVDKKPSPLFDDLPERMLSRALSSLDVDSSRAPLDRIVSGDFLRELTKWPILSEDTLDEPLFQNHVGFLIPRVKYALRVFINAPLQNLTPNMLQCCHRFVAWNDSLTHTSRRKNANPIYDVLVSLPPQRITPNFIKVCSAFFQSTKDKIHVSGDGSFIVPIAQQTGRLDPKLLTPEFSHFTAGLLATLPSFDQFGISVRKHDKVSIGATIRLAALVPPQKRESFLRVYMNQARGSGKERVTLMEILLSRFQEKKEETTNPFSGNDKKYD